MAKVATQRSAAGTADPFAPVAWPAGKVCMGCLNAGWVINDDVAPSHADRVIKCPSCGGASIAGRDDPAVIRLILKREHALQVTPDTLYEGRTTPTPPPPDFSRADGKVPLMGADHLRDQQRRQIAANVAAVAAKLKGGH